jgi:antitoxin HicB
VTRRKTDYERIEADDKQRPALRAEELVLAATCALSEELERQGLTKAGLAERMGRTRGDISQVFSGSRNLTLRTLAELADALGCKVQLEVVPDRRKGARRQTPARAKAS